ncbi:MAG: HAMP domain-containing sensor histidine kinase [Gemmatimonadetes bacterium]|nr:HAMP domain-containing sensor histidine kinase [Gemmatimonadota bacterium]
MRTIRGRLAVGYAIALATTMFAFAATIYFVQRADRFAQLDPRAGVQADIIAALVADAYDRLGHVVVVDTVGRDSTGAPLIESALDQRVGDLLVSVQDYVVIVDSTGGVLYATVKAGSLRDNPIRSVGLPVSNQLERLANAARNPNPGGRYDIIDLGSPAGQIRYYTRPITGAGSRVASILAGASTAGVVNETRNLVVGMLVSAPFLLMASMIVGYVLAGRNLRPVDTIIDEIEAITDGRSLHRRVVQVRDTAELARLSTTLNAMLIRLERNFLSLRRFTADASHELKTPLTVLRFGVERAITHPSATREVMEVLEETLVEVNRMTEIVDSLLTLARVDEGRAPLHLERTDFRELLGEIAETANLLGEQAAVDVAVSSPDSPIIIPIDRGRVRQLLLNLLTNAIKYTPRGGKIDITCTQEAEEIVIEVADTGIGIATGDLPHIFDRFWRADAARSRTGERPGSGLGLAICRWIAEAHGGSITVHSRRGDGTTFRVTLPRGEAEQSPTVALA